MLKNLKSLKLIIIVLLLFALLQQISYGEAVEEDQSIRGFIKDTLMLEEEPIISIISIEKFTKLVQFSFKQGDVKGYIVIKINFDQVESYGIIEYGLGHTVPYTREIIINEQLKDKSLSNFTYLSPFESYWSFETAEDKIYLDGATGDWLPALESFEPKERTDHQYLSLDNYRLISSLYNQELIFNPYDDLSWLIGDNEEKGLTKEELVNGLNNQQRILYTGSKFNDAVQFAYSVVGYQQFENGLYMAVYNQELEHTRYLLLDELMDYGSFSLFQ